METAETAQFLARVLPPGNFIAIGYHRTPGKVGNFGHGFFPGGDFAAAAGLLHWSDRKGFDSYHAMASFRMAEPDGVDVRGKPKFRGRREADNAQSLKAFWVDLDVKRPGDKKTAETSYPDQANAVAWATGFHRAAGLPRPNLAVSSGYGIHLYWVLEDALPVAEWLPLAHALRVALVEHGFRGDAGITADPARVLRPPGTSNHKVPGRSVPVTTLAQGPDVVVADMRAALLPWVGKTKLTQKANVGAATMVGQVSNVFQARAQARGGGAAMPNMAAAAQANLPSGQKRSLALIAPQCAQVGHSLTHHGDGDSRRVWYLGHLTLAHFCADGAAYVHPIGDGDPRYKAAETDACVAQIVREVTADPSIGPPTCAHYEQERPALCGGCPHRGLIKTPWDLGVPQSDLPASYRRNQGRIEYSSVDSKGNLHWQLLTVGDVHTPRRHAVGADEALSFTYVRAGVTSEVYVVRGDLPDEAARIRKLLNSQGVHVDAYSEKKWRDLLMAWMGDLIDKRAAKAVRINAWGWHEPSPGKLEGFAAAGRLYRRDGSVELVHHTGGDQELLDIYTPTGTLAAWQQACAFVTSDKPDLQAIVAASFAAPLIKLLGYAGSIMSVWGPSGVGKSCAMYVAQGVWAGPRAMYALDDTNNSTFDKIASTNGMPALWDELRMVTADQARDGVARLFHLTQGKEKGRMRSDVSQRTVRLWETILVATSNRPMMDQIIAQDEGTDAGAVRVIEYGIKRAPLPALAGSQLIVQQARDNYGRAGEVYAAWLAQHPERAQAVLVQIQGELERLLAARQEERFQIAGIASLLAAAAIANKLKLVDWDWAKLRDFLAAAFIELREARRRDLVVQPGGYDLDQILANFASEYAGRRLVTDKMARQGGRTKIIIKHVPSDPRLGPVIHISQEDQLMRVDRKTLSDWLIRRRLSPADVLAQMTAVWHAHDCRGLIGSGTHLGVGQRAVLDIPLLIPELEVYLNPPVLDGDNAGAGERVRRNGLPNAPPAPDV